MLRLRKKNLITILVSAALLLFFASSLSLSNEPILALVKHPLKLMVLMQREIEGLLFFHHNLLENQRLSRESDLMRSKINSAQEVYAENIRLKNLLSLKQKASEKLIAAQVIARSSDNWASSALIDKGRHHGARRGMAVISYGGLVGRVVDAEQFTSKILLLNDPNIRVSAMIQRSRQEGLVSGTLGNYLVMKYLPEDADAAVGDSVVTSGLSTVYPKGLLIGTVVDIGKEFSGLSFYAVIRPAVNLACLEEVLLVVE